MQEVRLRKKGSFTKKFPSPGFRDYRKVLNFQVNGNWIDKVPICTAKRGRCENLCLGFCPDSSGNCIFQFSGVHQTECDRGKL
jgi:hypothetical protein